MKWHGMKQEMIEWKRLPKGTYYATSDDYEYEVWQVGKVDGKMCWRWTVINGNRKCIRTGRSSSLDEACEEALRQAEHET